MIALYQYLLIVLDKYNRDCLNYDKELNSPINVNMLDEEINENAEKIHSF